jgi:preprotein translocase subunit SecG
MFFVFAEIDVMGWLDSVLSVLAIVTAMLMVFFILLQEGKGGGLAALGGTKAAGVEGVTNPIRKATGYLAAMFFVMIIILGILHKPDQSLLEGVAKTEPAAKMSEGTSSESKADTSTTTSPTVTPPVNFPVNVAPGKTDTAATKGDAEKPADTKTDASKSTDTKADASKSTDTKTDAAKPTDAKATEPAKADAPKAPDAPKPDDTKKVEPKPDSK